MKGRDSKKMAAGEIVWVAVREEEEEEEEEGESPQTCWWPGLIQRVDSLGVFVSFFNLQIPRYFHQSQIHSFDDDDFRSPLLLDYNAAASAHSKRDSLLDCALRLLYRRTVLRLRCRCLSQMAESKESELVGDDGGFEAKRSFKSAGVLGFVQSVAVLPWVEVGDFVGAVKRIAHVQAFRGYSATKQKSVYQKAKRQWGNERGRKHSVLEESNALELDDKCPLLFLQKEMNPVAGVPIRINTTILLPKQCLQPLREGQLDIKLTQAKQVEAQPLYSGTCISYVRVQECDGRIRFLKDRSSIAYAYNATQSISKGFWNEGAKVHTNSSLLLPLTNESVFNDAVGTNVGTDIKDIHDAAATGMCSLQFHRTRNKNRVQPHGGEIGTSFKSYGFWYEGPEVFNDSSLLQPLTSESVFNDAVRTNVGTDTMDIDCSAPTGICSLQYHQTCDKIKLQSHGGESDTSVKSNGFWNKGAEVFCASSFLQSTSEPVCNEAIGTNGGTHTKGIHDSSTTGIRPLLFHQTHDKDKIPPRSCENCKFIKSNGAEVHHDSSLPQSSTSESVFNDGIRTNMGTNSKNIDDTAATGLWPLQYHQTCDKIKMQQPGAESGTSVESDRVVSSSGGSIWKNMKLLKPCHSSVNSQVGVAEQSKAASISVSRSLHMMFPKDYNPPSQEELVKKFCRFGPVDHLKTKFYFYGRSAQVVFYDSNDAVVAYNYAKRRRLFFGQANVRYWLDPFEQERRGTVEQVGSVTKSCLKRSNPRRNEEKRKHQRVRFLMET